MNVSPDVLRKDLVAIIRQIEVQLNEIKEEARLAGIQPEKLRSNDGSWVIIPLLSAKANAYSALVMLNEHKR